MSRRTITSIWLVPSSEDSTPFERVINALTGAQNGVRFQPHMTLGSIDAAEPNLSAIFGSANAIRLKPCEIDRTDTFTMSYFVRFERTSALARLRSKLEAIEGFRAGRAFDPHVSLCYGAPPGAAEINKGIDALLQHPIRFDQLWAMEIEVPLESYSQVRHWRRLSSFALSDPD